MVSDNRKGGVKNISKYLFILLKSLRKLDKYYPNEKEKFLYRCINSKVNLNYDIFNKKLVPYITGNIKTFWGFTSSSPDIKMTYNFLKGEENNKSVTIFTLTGKVWGYDITLFNYYNEKEILIEPERKYKIDEVIPPINEVIHIRCEIQDNPLILNENLFYTINKNYFNNEKEHIQNNNYSIGKYTNGLQFDYLLKGVFVGDADTGKSNILLRFVNDKYKSEYQLTVGVEFCARTIEIRNKIYRIQVWVPAGQENFRSISRAYYQNTAFEVFVYSITNRDSFEIMK